MISINTSFISTTAKMTDRSVVSACPLGLSGSAFIGTGMSGFAAVRPATLLAVLPVRERRNERPTKALEAGVAAGEAKAYAFAATGAETKTQTQQHHTMWAFRGLEPWSDPA
ncbi:hypothetical protein AMK26_09910 [Streptomyces sp. CB03234]|uniref:hypothetical protein n=1 Tax=Streptomyces sp. (strain CB03234) TaxID=1703937 RepID=UPI00093A3696|nr:hypothetical protein [Streptomyces sp. CB03234]OKK06343.1 hypothetical protein AMK26_09910 [Streptomyces sp. CB03234]